MPCGLSARSEQGQHLVQVASLTVNKWSNLGRSHSVAFGVSLCSKNMESFSLCPVCDGKCVATSRKMMNSDINRGNLDSVIAINSLLPVTPNREGAQWTELKAIFLTMANLPSDELCFIFNDLNYCHWPGCLVCHLENYRLGS